MTARRYHILIDASEVSNEILSDKKGLKNFLSYLPGVINMHPLTEPLVIAGVPENPGLTGFVIIDYSHISIHAFTNSSEVLVDVFSCKPYEQEVAKKAVLDYFQIGEEQAHIQEVSWG